MWGEISGMVERSEKFESCISRFLNSWLYYSIDPGDIQHWWKNEITQWILHLFLPFGFESEWMPSVRHSVASIGKSKPAQPYLCKQWWNRGGRVNSIYAVLERDWIASIINNLEMKKQSPFAAPLIIFDEGKKWRRWKWKTLLLCIFHFAIPCFTIA